MLIEQTIRVTNSHLHCPMCGHDAFQWDDVTKQNGILVYSEICDKCEEEFLEHCTDPEDDYLYTTYTTYVKSVRSNIRW